MCLKSNLFPWLIVSVKEYGEKAGANAIVSDPTKPASNDN